jgi:hypothetical protein
MKEVRWFAAVIACGLVAGTVRAATVYEQALPADWLTGAAASALCSPCAYGDRTQRVYATFDLEGPAKLDGLEFAVINNVLGPLGDFSVSIWRQLDTRKDKPFREIVFGVGSYTPAPTGRSFVDIALPGWTLAKGSYWLSIVGLGQDGGLQWGFDPAVVGDDFLFRNDMLVPPPDYHVGFRLYQNDRTAHARVDVGLSPMAFSAEPAAVPVPGTLGLLGTGLAALALFRRRGARRTRA